MSEMSSMDRVGLKVKMNCGRCAEQRAMFKEASDKLTEHQRAREFVFHGGEPYNKRHRSLKRVSSSSTNFSNSSGGHYPSVSEEVILSPCDVTTISETSTRFLRDRKLCYKPKALPLQLIMPSSTTPKNNFASSTSGLQKTHSVKLEKSKSDSLKYLTKCLTHFSDHNGKSLDALLDKLDKQAPTPSIKVRFSSELPASNDEMLDGWEDLSEIVIPGDPYEHERRKLVHAGK